MRGRTRGMVAVAITSLALFATACGGGGAEPEPGAEDPAGQAGGEISIRGCTPENPLIPGNTSEVCGGNVIDAMAAKLVRYDPATAAPSNDIAESIESEDNQTFTVKLKQGYKFQDGTEVKAKNFVDAWNYTAAGVNGQAGSYFYGPVEGYDDTQCGTNAAGEADCKGKPAKSEKMSGLKVVDDYTFTIKTSEPGLQPAGPVWATRPSRRCRTPSSPIRKPSRRSRSEPGLSRWRASPPPRWWSDQVRRLLR